MQFPSAVAIAALLSFARAIPADVGTSASATSTGTTSTTSDSATASESSSSSACSGNTASTRSEWCDYSLTTDYYNEVPDTGVTREYWFELVNTTLAPDGYSRNVLTVNGTIPGPTIYADWGDNLILHFNNALENNGTSIHFHGIRQNYTNQNDGVISITQCPTAPGESITYKWRATQYGTTWYHSHYALQAWEGVFGGIVINGPASANYDNDAGIVFLNDWTHPTADALWAQAQTSGPPTLDNGLINGTNVYGSDGASDQTGSRFKMAVTSGESYRLRLVNGALDTHFKFSVDNHTLTVIASDLVPIEPYNTTVLNINIGQRYDVILTANQESIATDFWMRAIPQAACSDNDSTDNIKGIVHYGTSTDDAATPTTTGYDFTDACVDETDLVPVISNTAGTSFYSDTEAVTVGANSANLFKWYLNSISLFVEWEDPTLLQIYNGLSNWTSVSHTLEAPEADEWQYLIIQTQIGVAHPIHLHGHDFLVLAQGSGTYSSSVTLNTDNPPRRDTATLPASGYLVLAFKTDNPGAWLMHCHIGWHTEEGLALQVVERYDEIAAIIDSDVLSSTCSAWATYADASGIEADDAGI